jgi:uncharacterized membrane protein
MPTDPGTGRDELPGVERLLTLSDGVVAIALTLLVLQLRVPPVGKLTDPRSAAELAGQLGNGGGELISYAISFYVIAQFWLAHHRVFRQITGHQEGIAWLNFAFLFSITVMPFTSDLLGAYGSNPLAVDIFAANLLLANLATQATLAFGRRKGLLTQAADSRAAQATRLRAVIVMAVVALSIGVAWGSTSAAKYCWVLIAAGPWAAKYWSARPAAAPPSGPPGTAQPGSRPEPGGPAS